MTRGKNFDPHDDPMAFGVYPAAPRDNPSQSWTRDREALTKWAFGVITTAILALSGWLWAGFTSHETRLVTLETEQKIDKAARSDEQRRLDTRLDRMDQKLDQVLIWQRRDLHSPGTDNSTR